MKVNKNGRKHYNYQSCTHYLHFNNYIYQDSYKRHLNIQRISVRSKKENGRGSKVRVRSRKISLFSSDIFRIISSGKNGIFMLDFR